MLLIFRFYRKRRRRPKSVRDFEYQSLESDLEVANASRTVATFDDDINFKEGISVAIFDQVRDSGKCILRIDKSLEEHAGTILKSSVTCTKSGHSANKTGPWECVIRDRGVDQRKFAYLQVGHEMTFSTFLELSADEPSVNI